MKQVNIFEFEKLDIKSYDNIEELIKYIRTNNITLFQVAEENDINNLNCYIFDAIKNRYPEYEVSIFNTEHNFSIYCSRELFINKDAYLENKKIIDNEIENSILSTDTEHINFNKYNYSEKLLLKLIDQKKYFFFSSDINLSEEVINLLKEKHKVAEYFNPRKIISTDKMLDNYYEHVIDPSIPNITLYDTLTDYENLKYIPEDKHINIRSKSAFDYSDNSNTETQELYDAFYYIANKLRENGQKNKITIEIHDREKFKLSKLYESNLDIMVDGLDTETYSLKNLKQEDKLLDLMISDIKDSNYSMFEKFLAAYNIVKKFKKYNENEEKPDESRKISKLLNNEYMVCVGYARLLEVLLNKLGIPNYDYGVSVDTSYDKGFSMDDIPLNMMGHARIIVNINDPKYNIKGNYVVDPTWDNNLGEDYYCHSLMTFDKTSMARNLVNLTNEDLLLNCKSEEEYYEKTEVLLKRERNKSYKINGEYEDVKDLIFEVLFKLDKTEYDRLKQKYNFGLVNSLDKDKKLEMCKALIKESAHTIINDLGKDVPIETICDAAYNVNKEVFNFNQEQAKEYKEKLFEDNIQRDKEAFPYYYEENVKGSI